MLQNSLAVCLQCGDTLVDEHTEDKDERGVSHRADLIPDADTAICHLKEPGYPLARVADCPSATFTINLGPHGLDELFDAYAISEELRVSKPHLDIFHHALNQLGNGTADYSRVVMVGNNLSQDIKGANAPGIIRVWLDWAPRRKKPLPTKRKSRSIRSRLLCNSWTLSPKSSKRSVSAVEGAKDRFGQFLLSRPLR